MRLLFGGDVMLGRTFNQLDKSPWGYKFKLLTDQVDLFSVNLETTITNSTNKLPNKVFNFQMKPEHTHWLNEVSVDHVAIANNHTYDYQEKGLSDTIGYLEKHDVMYSGTIDRPYIIITVRGKRIGIVSMTDHPNEFRGHINFVNLHQIKDLKSNVDILVVHVHWGPNWQRYISDETRQLAHQMCDHGANIIIGTSPHHVQEVEVYKESIICYSVGDLIDDYAIDDEYRNDLGVLIEIEFDHDTIMITPHPTRIKDYQVELLNKEDPDYKRVMKDIGA